MAKRENGEQLLMLLINNYGSEMSLGDALKLYQRNDPSINSIETAFNNKTYGNKNLQWEKLFLDAGGVFNVISPAALKAFTMLTLYANEKTGKIRIGFPRLQELTKMTKPTLIAAIKECEEYALLITYKGIGKLPNTYWINPEVAQIGKNTHEGNKRNIIEFYKETGSEREMVNGMARWTKLSKPHELFQETTQQFKNTYFRDSVVVKKNAYQVEDIVGVVSNTEEHNKIMEEQKKTSEKKSKKIDVDIIDLEADENMPFQ